MKNRFFALLLALALLAGSVPAGAETAYESRAISCQKDYVSAVGCHRGVLYVFRDSGLYSLPARGTEMTQIAPADGLPKYLCCLFSDGQCLYGITDGEESRVIRLLDEGGAFVNETAFLLKADHDLFIEQAGAKNGLIYWHEYCHGLSETVIHICDLQGTPVSDVTVKNPIAMDVLEDGSILLLTHEKHFPKNTVLLKVIDRQTGKETVWATVGEDDSYFSSLMYDAASGTAYYLSDDSIRAVRQNGRPETVSSFPQGDVAGCCLLENGIALVTDTLLVIRTFEKSSQSTSLRILDIYGRGEEYTAFIESHPDIPLKISDAGVLSAEEQFVRDMLVQRPDIDIYVLRDMNLLHILKTKGFFADLYASADLKKWGDRLYPNIRAPFLQDGKLAAFPKSFFSEQLCYYRETFERLQLAVPGTWEEYLDFCLNWYDSYADDMPGIHLDPFINEMTETQLLSLYDNEMTRAGKTADYRSETLRRVLEKFYSVQERAEQYGSARGKTELVYVYDIGALDDNYRYAYMPLTFEKGAAPLYVPMEEASYYVVNPWSAHPEEALELVYAGIRSEMEVQQTTLYETLDLPIPDPYYEEYLAFLQGELARLEAVKEAAAGDPDALEEAEENVEKKKAELLDYEENGRWMVTAEDMERIRPVNRQIYFSDFNPIAQLLSDEPEFFDRLNADNIASFLNELDSRVRMIRQELEK